MSGLETGTPAQQRLADELLGWGRSRPSVDGELFTELRGVLEEGIAGLDGGALAEAANAAPRERLLITKTRLDRLVCDGLALDAAPFEHTRASSRGILGHAAVERDWREGRARDPDQLAAVVWEEEASRRPGDPASLSAWMNARDRSEADELRAEVSELVTRFREVWPPLPAVHVEAELERAYEADLADGRVVLFGRPDIVLHSRRRDDRARTLVIDLKTGRPRPEQDRHELRFYALLVALASGEPPFRWATHYVTEGRYEYEDLRVDTLRVTALRVVDGVRQQLRIAGRESGAEDPDLVIRGGAWCRWCLREPGCAEAARAKAEHAMSHPDATMDP